MQKCKPFVKWVGGKTQLISEIESALPENFAEIKDVTYIEPFVGGGAVLFWMLQNYSNISHAVINDVNLDLITTYRVVKDRPNELIEYLSEIESQYFKLGDESRRKEFFLSKREEYNYNCTETVMRAGLFIFLNRTCFNGLYRVNKSGYFNVPFGRYANPKICDKQTILADSELLQRVEILHGDFTQTIECTSGNSLFYFDPPYKPISATSSFTNYTKDSFGDSDQFRLAAFCDEISKKGYGFILSNSDLKSVDHTNDFFDDLYNGFDIKRIYASRMINSKASQRGKIKELLVSNVKLNYERAF